MFLTCDYLNCLWTGPKLLLYNTDNLLLDYPEFYSTAMMAFFLIERKQLKGRETEKRRL